MAGKADAVAQAVREVFAVTGVCDDLARGGVELAGSDAGLGGSARGVERALKHCVGLQEVLRCLGSLAYHVGAGAIGLVAGRQRAAQVHHHGVPLFEDTVGKVVVRVGTIRPGADDDEGDGFVLLQDQRVQLVRDLALRATGLEQISSALVHAVDGCAGLCQLDGLLVVFDHEQLRHRVGGKLGCRQQRLEGEDVVRGQ